MYKPGITMNVTSPIANFVASNSKLSGMGSNEWIVKATRNTKNVINSDLFFQALVTLAHASLNLVSNAIRSKILSYSLT